MTSQVLLVHGAGGGAYEADAKLVTSLRSNLGPDYTVRYPQMPNEADPDYETWKNVIAEELAAMGDGAVLVGHSIGGSVVIRAAVDEGFTKKLAGVFLVAAPFWHHHEVWHWKEVELPKDAAERIPKGVPVFLYHGREDETVPVSHVDMYAQALPQASVCRLQSRNHQLNDDLTEVAHDIRRLA